MTTTITPWEERTGMLFTNEEAMEAEIAELRAKLEQIEKQEPVAVVHDIAGYRDAVFTVAVPALTKLYALPPSPVNAELVEALEQCAESLAFARDRLAMTGEGDGQGRLAYASDDIGSLAALVAARKALSTAQAKPALTQEQDNALCEGHFNSDSDEYFKARPQLDSAVNRRIFYAGHRKGWLAKTIEILKGAL